MRAFAGQRSDNQPIQRTREEKQRQLRELKEAYASLKPHTSPALKESMKQQIISLQRELAP